ncbi:hypothetical protein K9F62_06215 [Desulfovibrio sp. JY]|nr:hypothetical protein K9F62_06215 [Desulfovibrio sp. JY]
MSATMDVLERSRARRARALEIVDALGLMGSWSRFGRPVLVGAVAHDLALDPDIDLEVYCETLRPEDGFAVLAPAARHPGVRETLFQNHMHGPDKALYWQIRFQDADDTTWKIDMWSAPEDYPLPRGEHLVGPLRQAMTPQLRRIILELKAWRAATPDVDFLSIDLYRAVVTDGVRDPESMRDWLARNETGVLSDWRP